MKRIDLDELMILITGLFVIGISISDLFGFLDNLPWLENRIPKVILILIGALFLLFNRKMNRLTKSIGAIDTHKASILEFNNAAEIYDFISKELLRAKESIEDITWGSYTGYRTKEEQDSYENYVKTIEKVCRRKNVMYKEISSLSDEHYFNRAKNLFRHYNYHLAYHDTRSINVPLISYVLIDRKEVILGFSRIPGEIRPLDGIKYLCIRDPDLVKFFSDYYDSIWGRAIKLKESNQIDQEQVEQIGALLTLTTDGRH